MCAGSCPLAALRLSSHARKSYLRLARSDRRLFERIDRALDRLGGDPTSGKPLAGPLSGHRALRVGSLRIVYRIADDDRAVLVLDIAQRGGVYR
ncbi:MAG: type II toxin-antitoxin system RelE/ParE family toxin [Acidobacteriota bacterium]|nr:type II toxin-antitoxin system RelE/ParE family toxin [Acidobacteriota bacterium]